ncbi:MAG: ATP-dependent DNA ligase [Candidatus Undinarchaeales archaeon]
MKYKKLAEVYAKLEGTTKKLEKRDILADFFKKTDPEVLEIVATLVMGRIFPAWKEKEMGIAENLMIKTISKTAGVPENQIEKEMKKEGDLGAAAENILKKKKQKTLSKRTLSIKNVYEKFENIPDVSGSGSIDEKTSILAELLSSASPEEGKYIVRTVLQEMRVGVGEGIVRNAVAKAFDIDKDVVEHAYNVRNDFGEVAKIAKKKGEKGLKKLKLEIGRPIKPMLAQKAENAEQAIEDMGGKAAFEIKYDGMRIQIHKKGDKIIVFTRRLDDVTKQFPDIVKYAEKGIKAEECIIEGEAVGMNPKTKNPLPFQKLSRRIKRKYDIEEIKKKIPIEVNLFDIMFLEGETLVDEPFKKRRKELENIIDEIKGKFQLAESRVYS